jgi:hypothetical protein
MWWNNEKRNHSLMKHANLMMKHANLEIVNFVLTYMSLAKNLGGREKVKENFKEGRE